MPTKKPKIAATSNSLDSFLQETLATQPAFAKHWEASRVKREIATLLIGARTRAGLSASQLARNAGWDRATVSRLESANGGAPEAETIDRYLAACGKKFRLGYVVVDGARNRIDDVLEISAHASDDRFLRSLKGLDIGVGGPARKNSISVRSKLVAG